MLKIDPKYILQAQAAVTPEDLWPLLQNAIELEHATIPPYLTALYSIVPGTNTEISEIIHSIVIEEMLHMSIASNILNALGGSPNINAAGFVPSYPGPLPMGIGGSLIVGLEKYSKSQVKNVFMEIEEPETPIVFEKRASLAAVTFRTIGEFYTAIQDAIGQLPNENMPGDPARQVVSKFFSADQLFPILTTTDAINAINIIIEQGEGTTTSPLDQEGELAHYYKFEELFFGNQLVKDPNAENGFSFTGPAIPFDPASIYPLYPNTKAAMLTPGSEGRRRIDEFNNAYSALLSGLHNTFNGQPNYLDQTIGLMYDVKLTAQRLCAMTFPEQRGYNIGPSFEYIQPPLNA